MPLTREELAYVAGIIDGEGSISLCRSFAKRTRGRYVYPIVRIANTDSVLIGWIESRFDSGCRSYTSAMNERCKPCHHITWAASKAVGILKLVYPFLVVKKDRAKIVIDLWDSTEKLRKESGGYWGNGHPIPEVITNLRDSSFKKLAILNKRGA